MKLKQIRELIKDLPDDIEVVAPSSDHSYGRARAWVVQAAVHGGDYYEHDEGTDEPTEKVLVVGFW